MLEEPPFLPLAYLIVAAAIAWIRRSRPHAVAILRDRRAN
jgi:hypothetical protein